ncbi:MAG TPA: cell wall hydrolase, partial [Sphingomicrobium sp.]|nr:cell wall hydrolase [Sphingomicrobium sp.]
MVKLIGGRAASVVMGLFMLGLGSSAAAQNMSALANVPAAVRSIEVDNSAKPLGSAASPASAYVQPAIASTVAVATPSGTIMQPQPAQSVTVKLGQSIAAEAAWLYKAGWPLYALVGKFATSAQLDEETNCLATAVYFEARGESLEGQLAVARVVMNRASSGRYPPDWCGVVKQPAQFSFVHHGRFPSVDQSSDEWRKALGVTRLA